MNDLSILFALAGMSVGTISIAVLFLNSEKILPQFKRASELMSISVLSILIGTSALLLGSLLAIETIPDVIAATSLLVGVAVLTHLTRII